MEAVALQFGPFVTNDMTCGAHFIGVCVVAKIKSLSLLGRIA